MRISQFDVDIIAVQSRSFIRDGFRYISLPPQSTYSIHLMNNGNTRCDADVTVDGQFVGSWRIGSHDAINVERPGDMRRVFTFVGENSSIARRTGAIPGAIENGLISVVFKPAKESPTPRSVSPSRRISPMSASSSQMSPSGFAPTPESTGRYSSGVTVLGRRSSQEFSNVSSLTREQIDWNGVTEINIRLVVDEESGYYNDYVPISRRSPPRIDEFPYIGRRVD